MSKMLLTWDYCVKCGRAIKVGETCYEIGNDSYCCDCCNMVPTLQAWERMSEAEEGEAEA